MDAQSAGRGDLGANLNYVIDLAVLLVTFGYSYLQFLVSVVGSALKGLRNGLKGLKQKGLIGGLLSGLKGLLDNLATSSTKGVGDFISNLLA